MRIAVFGSGVVALCSAIRAAELGHHVRLHFTDANGDSSPTGMMNAVRRTSTSYAAAAFWTPFATGTYRRS